MSAAQDSQPFHWRYPDLDDKNFELHGRSLLIFLLIFAALLLLTLLILYIRWALHRPGPAPAPTPTNPSAPSGLDAGVISSLPVVLYEQQGDGEARGSADDQDSVCCSICLSVFFEGEKVKMLPRCRHSFHPECVDQWLKTRSSCPMCRAEIQEDDGGGGV